jgi:hypothetical protein
MLFGPDASKKVRPGEGNKIDELTGPSTVVCVPLVLAVMPGAQETPQGIVRWWRVFQERQENVTVPVRKRGHRFFNER